MREDKFAHKAEAYEQEVRRVDNVTNIANKIISEIELTKDMQIMDFGSGTGLLLEQIASKVDKITAIDISPSMNKVLQSKEDRLECKLEVREMDLTTQDIDDSFDGIISSMTIHHVQDVEALFEKFYHMLPDNGFIALADLDSEDGTFHKEDTGVFHFGFDRDWIVDIAKSVGFKNVKIQTVANVLKPYGEYPVFLLSGTK